MFTSFIFCRLNTYPPTRFHASRLMAAFILFCPILCHAFQGIDIPDARPFQEHPLIKIKKNILYFDGLITPSSAVTFIKLMRSHSVKKISINSLGGDVESAIKMGDFIYRHDVDIEVRTVCASACANYLFTAGRNKFLSTDSILMWHGGVNSPEKEVVIKGDISRGKFFNLKNVKKIKESEKKFYKEIQINPQISFCPQLEENYREKFPEKWFSYTPQDMEKFGVKNIHFAKSASQWLLSMRKQHVLFATYCEREL